MSTLTASVLNNFADLALSLPHQTLELTIKQNPTLVDSTGYDGKTALQKAVYMNNIQVAKVLLQNGADPNFKSQTGETAVHYACLRGGLRILVLLLKHGGDTSLGDSNGRVAVHSVAYAGSVLLMQYLQEVCDVNLEVTDNIGSTPLHTAAAAGHMELVKYLALKKMVNRHAADNEGNIPLHCAAVGGVSGVSWLLIYPNNFTDLLITNQAGQTPLQLAQASKTVSPDCVKWLNRWTGSANHNTNLESPWWPWVLHLLAPGFIFHSGILLSYTISPSHQYMISVPAFIFACFVMIRQQHRLKHPSRWANPIYLGAYMSGLLSTILCALIILNLPHALPGLLSIILISLTIFHCGLLYKLLKGDPGRIHSDVPLKEVLRGVGEEVVKGYCIECQIATPPLSHHCRLCESCHYHMDHHCLFLNSCVAINNHWHFVVFIVTNFILQIVFVMCAFFIVPKKLDADSGADYIEEWFSYLLNENCWVLLLIGCNLGSAMWAVKLFKLQFSVISTQQTTVCRLKLGPIGQMSFKEKLKNFQSFMINKKVSVVNQAHYFQEV